MDHLVNENRKLEEAIVLLQNRVKLYERLFDMSLNVIDAFSHFIPDVVDKLKVEIETAKADID